LINQSIKVGKSAAGDGAAENFFAAKVAAPLDHNSIGHGDMTNRHRAYAAERDAEGRAGGG
jgi:hypothetical protein